MVISWLMWVNLLDCGLTYRSYLGAGTVDNLSAHPSEVL